MSRPSSTSVTVQHLAEAGGGVFDHAAAVAAGIEPTAVDQERRIGRIVEMHPRIYRSAGSPVDQGLRRRAALLAAGADAALSHRTAAHVYELPGGARDLVDIIVPHQRRPRLVGVYVHRSLRLPARHVQVRDGCRVTTVDRTLADLGAVVPMTTVNAAVENAVVRRLTTVERLFALVDDHGRKGRTGIGTLRAVLEEWMLSERPPDSELEIAFARLARRGDFRMPTFQYEVRDRHGRFVARVDAAWPDLKLAAEVDGFSAHGTLTAFESDISRQNRLVLMGWTVLRFTWRKIVHQPAQVGVQGRASLDLLGT